MYLKKLEIIGFKSFANKTVLDFCVDKDTNDERKLGITAIVGPNGSGKSNIADAMRWVMGEQSVKNLRGKKSEDVIFAGSGTKSRLGHASVSLYFDNSDKRIPVEFSEVVVTRKLFRSGESEYLINGNRVRLIDIADILSKAGIGKESYCVINQGMTDAVLNATPAERRSILEEAAGVKQYQIQKIRALKKLEKTIDNLEKVSGLVREIEPHLSSLKRQAQKAQKGKIVREDLLKTQKSYYAYLWHKFQNDRSSYFEEKESLGRDAMNIQREVDKLNDELKKESKKLSDSRDVDRLKRQRDDLYRKKNDLERDLAIAEGRVEILKEKRDQLDIIESIPVDKKYVVGGIKKIIEKQKVLVSDLEKVKSLDEIKVIKKKVAEIKRELQDLGVDVDRGEVKAGKSPEQTRKQELVEKEIVIARKNIGKIVDEISKTKKQVGEMTEKIRKESEDDRMARRRFFEVEQKMRSRQYDLDRAKDRFNEAKIKLARVEVREEDLVNESKDEIRMDIKDIEFDGKEIDKFDTERKISRLKIQVEQIGGIDPMVVEEYKETNERYDLLINQSKDLEEAMVSLKKVIKEMDQKIEKVFAEAFVQINKEFSKYFSIVFGGGKAKLVKSYIKKNVPASDDEDDDEDADQKKSEIGIDIQACPPKKKISSLSMLSGGERSLTSIALLFAIISHNPPPFAILDEVEAALDEANSRRFGKILQELSGSTQFIAITHNRETMRQASYLYGVTMGDDGISKVLSVKLDQIGNEGRIKK